MMGGVDVTNRNHHMSHGNQPPLSEGSPYYLGMFKIGIRKLAVGVEVC